MAARCSARGPVFIALLAASLGACLSVPAGECPVGAAGCDCLPGETCEAGLECKPPGVCIDEECTPGTLGCPCDNGQCLAQLTCYPDLQLCGDGQSTATGSGDDSASDSGLSTQTNSSSSSGSSSSSSGSSSSGTSGSSSSTGGGSSGGL